MEMDIKRKAVVLEVVKTESYSVLARRVEIKVRNTAVPKICLFDNLAKIADALEENADSIGRREHYDEVARNLAKISGYLRAIVSA